MRFSNLKKYLIFFKSGMQTTVAYRGMIALWFLGGILNTVLLGLLWWAIFSFAEGDTVGGYTFPQMLMYVLMSCVVSELAYTDTMGTINHDVHYGLIGMRLMKPINYRWQLGFTALGSFAARFIIIAVPMTVVNSLIMVFGFGLTGIKWYNVLLFIPACLMSHMTIEVIEFLFGQLAFRTQAMFGVQSMTNIITNFLSGAVVPLSLFPVWAQSILSYTPFPTMTSLPVRMFLGQLGWSEIGIAFGIGIAWIIALNILGQLLYKASVRKVVVFGG